MTKIIQVWLLILVFSNRMSCKTSNHILSYLKNSCALLDCDIRVSQGWQMGILNTTSYLKTSIVCWRIGYQQWCGPPFIVSYILGETDHNENFSYTTGKHCHFQKLPFWDLFSNDDIRWVINVTKWQKNKKEMKTNPNHENIPDRLLEQAKKKKENAFYMECQTSRSLSK